MKLDRATKLHFALGAGWAAYMLLVLWIGAQFGHQAEVMAAVVGLCIGYEWQQHLRGEGNEFKESAKDAAIGIAGGALLTWLATVAGWL